MVRGELAHGLFGTIDRLIVLFVAFDILQYFIEKAAVSPFLFTAFEQTLDFFVQALLVDRLVDPIDRWLFLSELD
jgi:hypothetical protein